jgi:hypothetical protein
VIEENIEKHRDATDPGSHLKFSVFQYMYSCGVRGDNTPEHAAYLGYLDAKDMYPDLKGRRTLESFYREVLDGTAQVGFTKLRAAAEAQKPAGWTLL